MAVGSFGGAGMKTLFIIIGALLVLAGLWVGAWGQEQIGGLRGNSYYVWPAFITGGISVAGGFITILFQIPER